MEVTFNDWQGWVRLTSYVKNNDNYDFDNIIMGPKNLKSCMIMIDWQVKLSFPLNQWMKKFIIWNLRKANIIICNIFLVHGIY